MLSDVFRTADHALELLLHRAASVNPWLCALGIVTYILAQAVRPRGWHTIIKAAYPDARELRPRHTMAAYLAGAGLNGVIPARGGDIVKLWLLHRRIPGARYPTLAATFVPETLFETLFGIGLVIWALSRGFLPVPTSSGELPHVDVTLVIAAPVPVGGRHAAARRRPRYLLYRAAAPPRLRPGLAPAPGRRDPRPAAPLHHRRGELAGARPADPPRLARAVHAGLPPPGHRGDRRAGDGRPGRRAHPAAGARQRRPAPGDAELRLRRGDRPRRRHRGDHDVHLRCRRVVDGRGLDRRCYRVRCRARHLVAARGGSRRARGRGAGIAPRRRSRARRRGWVAYVGRVRRR